MKPEDVIKKVNCCSCEKPLAASKFLNWVPFRLKAKWEFPVHGNILTKVNGLALGYVCDDCHDNKNEVKFAVEFTDDNKVIYHPLSELEEQE